MSGLCGIRSTCQIHQNFNSFLLNQWCRKLKLFMRMHSLNPHAFNINSTKSTFLCSKSFKLKLVFFLMIYRFRRLILFHFGGFYGKLFIFGIINLSFIDGWLLESGVWWVRFGYYILKISGSKPGGRSYAWRYPLWSLFFSLLQSCPTLHNHKMLFVFIFYGPASSKVAIKSFEKSRRNKKR